MISPSPTGAVVGSSAVLVAAGQRFAGAPDGSSLLLSRVETLWSVFAVGIGLLLPRPWALLMAVLPWPLGVGADPLIGRYAFLGEASWAVAAVVIAVGCVGVGPGLLLRRQMGTRR